MKNQSSFGNLKSVTSNDNTGAILKDYTSGLDYAKGYILSGESFIEQPVFYTHTTPSGGLNSTALDMSNLMILFLSDGSYKEKTILEKLMTDSIAI